MSGAGDLGAPAEVIVAPRIAEVTEPDELSLVAVNLLKGPIYRDTQEPLWVAFLKLRPRVADYFAVLGLIVEVDEAEGYSYLRSRPTDDSKDEYPRLIARRSLSFHVSLLLALLRKRLAEFDASSSDTRLTMTREEIVELLRLYLPESSNEARLVDVIGGHINRVVEMGFLRRMQGQEVTYLALPAVRDAVVVFGSGFNLTSALSLPWLAEGDRLLGRHRHVRLRDPRSTPGPAAGGHLDPHGHRHAARTPQAVGGRARPDQQGVAPPDSRGGCPLPRLGGGPLRVPRPARAGTGEVRAGPPHARGVGMRRRRSVAR